MLKIRLSRKGKKKLPFFNIIIINSRNSRNGKYIEKIGYYDPINKKKFNLLKNRLDFWIKLGAKTTKSTKKIIKFIIKKNEFNK
ncbi:30S ribosomal subunit protein S16 [Candidatus Zinderia insecticola CARI]|uniref:Small ribosomal subunit protein bS16 n=1 Tax=Zinderia insecticola (strain CARI) TaxID=871271 RepID=E0TJ59_ZINIC|nr:30S ribosomal subunit protein S16 [Candidatus Zinderia insecticola CARI]